jgi:multidrug efflux pump subunit AcrA (membrane-fusion protein)
MKCPPERCTPLGLPGHIVRLASFLAPLVLGCSPSPAPLPPVDEEKTLPSVAVVRPERAAIQHEVAQPGAIESFEETQVFAKVSGYVRKWNVDRGDRVRKGQVLAELWVPELEEELKQKEALIEQAEAQLGQAREAEKAAQSAHKSAVAQVEVAQAGRESLQARLERTQRQYERLQRVGSNVLDREQVEEARLGYETARAGVAEANARIRAAQAARDEARAQWNKATSDVRAAEASRKVAQKNRDYVKAQVQYTRLPAPYNGVVTQRGVNTGDFVRAATAGTDRPLYTVRRTDRMRVVVDVPESDAGWVDRGTAALLRVPKLPGQAFTGEVARISWALDSSTRTLRAEIDLPNADGRLRPGMYVHATLSARATDVLTLPRSAVLTEGEVTRGYRSYCYQVEDGKAGRLEVQIGSADDERIQVLKKRIPPASPGGAPRWVDFTGTEEVARDGLKGLSDGCPVTVVSQP